MSPPAAGTTNSPISIERSGAGALPTTRNLLWALIVAAAAVLCAAYPSSVFIGNFPGDFSHCIDSAWRLMTGQIPSVDFHTPIGPIFYLGLEGSLKAFSDPAIAVRNMPIFPALLLLIAGWRVLASSLDPKTNLLASLTLFLQAISPRGAGDVFLSLSYLAPYDRLAAAAAGPVLIYAFTQSRRTQAGRLEAFLAGALAAIAFLTKAPYGIVALACIVAGRWNRSNRLPLAISIAAASILLSSVVALWPSYFAGYAHDLISTAASTDWSSRLQDKFSGLSSVAVLPALALAATLALVSHNRLRTAIPAVASMLIMLNDRGEYPTLLAAALAIAIATTPETHGDAKASKRNGHDRRRKALGTLCHGLMLWSIGNDLLSIGTETAFTIVSEPMHMPSSAAPLALVIDPLHQAAQIEEANAGVSLIDTMAPRPATILVVSFSSLLPYLTQIPDSPGSYAWLDPHRTLRPTNPPPAGILLAGVDLIMIPTHATELSTWFIAAYATVLASDFHEVAANGHWIGFRRKIP